MPHDFAILLNQQVRGLWFFRMVFYLPSVVAGIATALLWRNILDPDFGLITSSSAGSGSRVQAGCSLRTDRKGERTQPTISSICGPEIVVLT